ncbi:MAG: 30S ribosomal protein S6 [Patescibacteria group bacterium]|nr:30S ribosomal protein S6 [Patescibacteria group bacterium]
MKYELSMFLSPKMTDEQAEKKAQELGKILEKYDAKVLDSNFLGMKDLAYQIKHFSQGYYFIAKIEADPIKIKKIRYQVADEMDVVRLLVTKQEKDVKLEAEHKEKAEGEEEIKDEKVITTKAQKIEEKASEIEEKTEVAKEEVKEEKEEIEEKKPVLKKKEEKETDLDKKLDKILEEDIVD